MIKERPTEIVSIPLRYAKNGCTGCERYRKAGVSIPLRYAKNRSKSVWLNKDG